MTTTVAPTNPTAQRVRFGTWVRQFEETQDVSAAKPVGVADFGAAARRLRASNKGGDDGYKRRPKTAVSADIDLDAV